MKKLLFVATLLSVRVFINAQISQPFYVNDTMYYKPDPTHSTHPGVGQVMTAADTNGQVKWVDPNIIVSDSSHWIQGNGNLIMQNPALNVGIGTTSPISSLNVVGTTISQYGATGFIAAFGNLGAIGNDDSSAFIGGRNAVGFNYIVVDNTVNSAGIQGITDSNLVLSAGGYVSLIGTTYVNAKAPLLMLFQPTITANTVDDSSFVSDNIVSSDSRFGGNTVRGNGEITSNIMLGGNSGIMNNSIETYGAATNGGIALNVLHDNVGIENNTLTGSAFIWDIGPRGENSHVIGNVLSGTSNETALIDNNNFANFDSIQYDTLYPNAYIQTNTFLGNSTIGYNGLRGYGSTISNGILLGSNVQHCRLYKGGNQINTFALFNSSITNDTVSITNYYAINTANNMLAATAAINNQVLINGQGGTVGIGTTTPNATAAVDVESTTQGFIMPRMTTTQKNAIVSPAEGLMVYDLTLHAPYYFNGTVWVAF